MADAEAEKTAALKRAYAEIMLSTAKESAARILVSERRAAQSLRNVAGVKEEAVAVMLRLKAVTDSKVKEAEKHSLSCIIRIKELEYQLSEAHGTVSCLREELKRVNNELEALKNHFDVTSCTCCHARTEESNHSFDITPSSQVELDQESNSDLEHANGKQEKPHRKSFIDDDASESTKQSKQFSPDNEYANNHDLASIIMRSKESDLYRNGCTQRIRALGHKVLIGKPPLNTNNVHSNSKERTTVKRQFGNLFDSDSVETSNIEASEGYLADAKVVIQKDKFDENDQNIFFKVPSKMRIRRCKKFPSLSVNPKGQGQVKAEHKPSDVNSSKGSRQNKMTNSDRCLVKTMNEKFENNSDSCFASLSTRGYTNPTAKKMRTRVCFTEVPQILSSSRTALKRTGKRTVHPKSYSKPINRIEPRTEDVNRNNTLMTTSGSEVVPLAEGAQNGESDLLEVKDSEPVLPNEKPSTLDVSTCIRQGTEKISPLKSDPKVENVCEVTRHSQGADGKFLKYTFQRKRKRGSTNTRIDVLQEKNEPPLKRASVNQNPSPDNQKPSIVNESSRDSRIILQVARQLISLSESRWP